METSKKNVYIYISLKKTLKDNWSVLKLYNTISIHICILYQTSFNIQIKCYNEIQNVFRKYLNEPLFYLLLYNTSKL